MILNIGFKTLRDFQSAGLILRKFSRFSKSNLRREAIRQIKKMKRLIDSPVDCFDLSIDLPFCDMNDASNIKEWRAHLLSIINYLIWFNNISSEDLKQNGILL